MPLWLAFVAVAIPVAPIAYPLADRGAISVLAVLLVVLMWTLVTWRSSRLGGSTRNVVWIVASVVFLALLVLYAYSRDNDIPLFDTFGKLGSLYVQGVIVIPAVAHLLIANVGAMLASRIRRRMRNR